MTVDVEVMPLTFFQPQVGEMKRYTAPQQQRPHHTDTAYELRIFVCSKGSRKPSVRQEHPTRRPEKHGQGQQLWCCILSCMGGKDGSSMAK